MHQLVKNRWFPVQVPAPLGALFRANSFQNYATLTGSSIFPAHLLTKSDTHSLAPPSTLTPSSTPVHESPSSSHSSIVIVSTPSPPWEMCSTLPDGSTVLHHPSTPPPLYTQTIDPDTHQVKWVPEFMVSSGAKMDDPPQHPCKDLGVSLDHSVEE